MDQGWYPLKEVECAACGSKFKVFRVTEPLFCSLECKDFGVAPEDNLTVRLTQEKWRKILSRED